MDFKIPDTPEELFRQGKKGIYHINRWAPTLLVLAAFLGLFLSSFYQVETDEAGVIRRFGKYQHTTEPGLHLKWPFSIDKLDLIKVRRVFKEEFGFRTIKAGIKTEYSTKSYLDESLMLTGDLNVLEVQWIIQFKVKDPLKLLFNLADPRKVVRDAAEVVMRQVIGDCSVTEALITRRLDINQEAQQRLQEILDSYESGIQIETVKLQDVNPPDEVKPSFNEVNEAKQEKEKVINQSWEAYNKAVPRTRGEAEKTIREAEGYMMQRVNEAQGDAAKFLATWEAYQAAKDVTRQRLYLEAMQDVIPRAGKVYVMDPKGNNMIPLLNLREGQ